MSGTSQDSFVSSGSPWFSMFAELHTPVSITGGIQNIVRVSLSQLSIDQHWTGCLALSAHSTKCCMFTDSYIPSHRICHCLLCVVSLTDSYLTTGFNVTITYLQSASMQVEKVQRTACHEELLHNTVTVVLLGSYVLWPTERSTQRLRSSIFTCKPMHQQYQLPKWDT